MDMKFTEYDSSLWGYCQFKSQTRRNFKEDKTVKNAHFNALKFSNANTFVQDFIFVKISTRLFSLFV